MGRKRIEDKLREREKEGHKKNDKGDKMREEGETKV